MGIDFLRLSDSRRPLMEERSTLNAWMYCLHLISFLGVITNCFLLGISMERVPAFVPLEYHSFVGSKMGKFAVVVALEHLLLGVKAALNLIISDEPLALKKKQARESLDMMKT